MRNINKFLLVGLCSVMLSACSSNEEVIDVEKPSGGATVDLTNGKVYDDFNDIDTSSAARGVSSPNVEIFSLDGASAHNSQAVSYDSPAPDQSQGAIGNSSVEISPVGQPDISYARTLRPPSYRDAPVTRRQPEQGNFVNIAAPGEPMVRIYFDHGSAELDTQDVQKIASIGQKYNANQGNIISVEGHASERAVVDDPRKRKEINLKVSMDRAYAVARALIYNGIPANSIRTVAWGEERPPEQINGMNAESAARRVEIQSVSGQ